MSANLSCSQAAQLVLGTAQFGMNYGISNKVGQVDEQAVHSIIKEAYHLGVRTLDTANVYGDSEEILGRVLKKESYPLRIISKAPPTSSAQALRQAFVQSLSRLQVSCIDGYLMHRFEDFINEEVRNELYRLKQDGLVRNIGISVYYPDQIEHVLKQNLTCDIIQLPLSVFDQRFIPLLKRLQERQIECHARSIFLQGLYFMSPGELPSHFQSVRDDIAALQVLSLNARRSLPSTLLNFVLSQSGITKVVLGVTSIEELSANVGALREGMLAPDMLARLQKLSCSNEQIILPFNWS